MSYAEHRGQLGLALERAARLHELLEVVVCDRDPHLLGELAHRCVSHALPRRHVARARVIPRARRRVLVRAPQLPEHAAVREHDHVHRQVHERGVGVACGARCRADRLTVLVDDDEQLVGTIGDAQVCVPSSCSSPFHPWRFIFSLRVARSMIRAATTPQKQAVEHAAVLGLVQPGDVDEPEDRRADHEHDHEAHRGRQGLPASRDRTGLARHLAWHVT